MIRTTAATGSSEISLLRNGFAYFLTSDINSTGANKNQYTPVSCL